MKDRHVVLISHDLTRTGAPLLLVETGVKLRNAGARVELVTLAADAARNRLAAKHGIGVLPESESFARCADADLVIANTAEAAPWVDEYLEWHPQGGRSLVWWLHELNVHVYAHAMHSLRRAAAALFDSHASSTRWTEMGVPLPGIVEVIHPGLDETFANRAARYKQASGWIGRRLGARARARRVLGVKDGDFALLLVGLYQGWKGHEELARVVGRLLEAGPALPLRMTLVGFSSRELRRSFLRGLDDAARRAVDPRRLVMFTEDVAPYYGASDAFVLNTQGPGENFGRVTVEAMAFKLPVLGTNAGGTAEIVEEGVTGLLHAVGTEGEDELGANILALMRDRERAAAMGESGSRRVEEKFSSRRFDAELGALLGRVLEARV